jgi:hypothetical protein
MPGKIVMCGAVRSATRPSLTIVPQSAAGGWMPRPRKLRPEPTTIIRPISVVV